MLGGLGRVLGGSWDVPGRSLEVMGGHGSIWKVIEIMGGHASIWKVMGDHGISWRLLELMGSHDSSCHLLLQKGLLGPFPTLIA